MNIFNIKKYYIIYFNFKEPKLILPRCLGSFFILLKFNYYYTIIVLYFIFSLFYKGGIMLKLFCTFFKIGICTFGGGYAMLPMLEREIVEKNHWASNDEILDYYAIGQCTPGIIAVNVSTFIGYKLHGVLGAMFSTLGLITPSLIIITVIASILDNITQTPTVTHIFNGIQLVVLALVLNAVIKIWKGSIKDIISFCIFLIVIILSLLFNLSPTIGVIIAALLGLLVKFIGGKK